MKKTDMDVLGDLAGFVRDMIRKSRDGKTFPGQLEAMASVANTLACGL